MVLFFVVSVIYYKLNTIVMSMLIRVFVDLMNHSVMIMLLSLALQNGTSWLRM